MDRYYKKWFFPLALPSMILFVVVILVPFLLGALYSFTSWRGTYFSGEGFGNPLWAFKITKLPFRTKNFWMLFGIPLNLPLLR